MSRGLFLPSTDLEFTVKGNAYKQNNTTTATEGLDQCNARRTLTTATAKVGIPTMRNTHYRLLARLARELPFYS